MSGRTRGAAAVVSREYQPAPEYCCRALELLLKERVGKEAAVQSSQEDAKEVQGARARSILSR